VHREFWCGELRERDQLEDLGYLEEYIKMDFQEAGRSISWIDPDQDREMCRAIVNVVINHRVL
jgi:hypothetical protein